MDARIGENWKEEEEFELYIIFVKPNMKTKCLLVRQRNSCKLKYAL
jgi:hypothetical protein